MDESFLWIVVLMFLNFFIFFDFLTPCHWVGE